MACWMFGDMFARPNWAISSKNDFACFVK
jgi:hypothetical protein